MQPPAESLHVAQLPREPFLVHSGELVEYLLSLAPQLCQRVLEIGCGPRSPLLPMLQRRWADAEIHQIDAQPSVVVEAAKFNPLGKVEQMLASNMASIEAGSKQLVISMSVFDQNPEQIAGTVAAEVHRVLTDDGIALYLHNEELNLPATAASMLRHASGPRLLLPSDTWKPTNDYEYCSADKRDMDRVFAEPREELAPLQWFIRGIHPQLFGDRPNQSAAGKIDVPFLRQCTVPVMNRVRRSVALLRNQYGVPLIDYRTTELLKNLVEDRLFCPAHGFRTLRSGVFELRSCTAWRDWFADRPATMNFVRGIARFGYSANVAPPPVTEFDQSLNRNPVRGEEDVLMIAYQYGFVAKKI
jgi:hypothetical protein